MKREVLSVYNERYYIIIALFSLLLIASIIWSIKKKSIKIYTFLCLIPIIFSLFLIIRNIRITNEFFAIYSDYDVMTVDYKIEDDSLLINNITRDYQNIIEGKTIKNIIYKDHTILIYTIDGITYTMPNCMNLDDLLK